MDNDLKKVDTLFHTTKSLDLLQQIVDHNFLVSFSREVFDGDITHIPMVSFSNILLFESKSQVNYGNYSIGLSKEWGIKKNLHPVLYTFEDSSYEKELSEVRDFSSLAPTFKEFKNNNHQLKFRFKKTNRFEVLLQNIINTNHDISLIEDLLKQLSGTYIKQELLSKKIVAKNNEGIEFICFNDREWRYLPSDYVDHFRYQSTEDCQTLLESSMLHYRKPENRLTFALEDIRFIVVADNHEIATIYSTLNNKYGVENVRKRVYEGLLIILSRESIYHNL